MNQNFNTVFARQFNAMNAAPVFKTDSKGRKVRVFTKAAPLTHEQIRHFYLNTRAVEMDEALEALGENVHYHVKVGNLRPDPVNADLLWVTKQAADTYKLPKVRLLNGALADYL